MIHLILTDDHPFLREGLKRIINGEVDMRVKGEAGSAAELMTILHETPCDVLILDISLQDRSGLEVLKDVRESYPHIRVLMLSMYPEEQFAVRVMRAGAHGYLTKEMAPEELLTAIRRIASGQRYITTGIAQLLATQIAGEPGESEPHQTLSDREYEVFLLLAEGKSMRQIAEKLLIGTSTVQTYRTRIMEKMGFQSNADLIAYAWRKGLMH